MKPIYIFALLFAVFITALGDGLEAILTFAGMAPAAVPVVGAIAAAATAPMGMALGISVDWCINVSMGSGLLLLLVMKDMYHPKFGTAGLVGAFIPGLDTFPFWIGVVIAGIVYNMSKQKGLLGAVAGTLQTATAAASGNITGAMQGAQHTMQGIHQAEAEAPANDNEASQERTPSTLQTKNFDGIKPYVPKAA